MEQKIYNLVVIGAGPAGLMAAIESFHPSFNVLILEKMHMPAIKLRLSGKGRCNITNDASLEEFLKHFGKNSKFLKFAFAEFFNKDLLEYFNKMGVEFKLERGGRWFPQNDKAIDIVNALLDKVKTLQIPIKENTRVVSIKKTEQGHFQIGIRKKSNSTVSEHIITEKVVVATGGKSYPKTGSTGDGLKWAEILGHKIVALKPSLVPIDTKGSIAKQLEGLSLKNVEVSVWSDNKKVSQQFGEMVFTDSGLSGPVILSLSREIVTLVDARKQPTILIDLKPALEHPKLEQRILREIAEHGKQGFKSLLKRLLPQKLIPVFLEILQVSPDKQLSQINAQERKELRLLLKEFKFEVSGYGSYDQAIVTKGGIRIKDVNPRTMESRLVKNLYFVGEVIDVDADTGGFNLQAAFSTGWIAGRAIRDTSV